MVTWRFCRGSVPSLYMVDLDAGSPISATARNNKVNAAGPAARVALQSRRRTDILVVGISNWPQGIFANPITVEGRAAWYSFAFWLRVAAGAHLDVDPLELQAGFRSLAGIAHPVMGEAFLSDQLENGAGYCSFLGQPTEFLKLLQQSDLSVPTSIATKWAVSGAGTGTASSHANICDTSCNLCLRDFQNMPYHGLLDWRMALDVARLAADATAIVDLVTPWGSTPNPWTSLLQPTSSPVISVMEQMHYNPPAMFGQLRGFIHKNRSDILLERHPLWDDSHPIWMSALAAAAAAHPGYSIKSMNPFRILRRPIDYI